MVCCAACKTERPAETVIEVEGVNVCRDSMGCLFRAYPWKNPNLPAEERAKLKAQAVA